MWPFPMSQSRLVTSYSQIAPFHVELNNFLSWVESQFLLVHIILGTLGRKVISICVTLTKHINVTVWCQHGCHQIIDDYILELNVTVLSGSSGKWFINNDSSIHNCLSLLGQVIKLLCTAVGLFHALMDRSATVNHDHL